jgi:hypothetical protein
MYAMLPCMSKILISMTLGQIFSRRLRTKYSLESVLQQEISFVSRGVVLFGGNGPKVKWKQSNTGALLGTDYGRPLSPDVQPLRKKVAYDRWFKGGGGNRFSGPPMWPDGDNGIGSSSNTDYTLFYKCDSQNQWLPIPRGFVVDEEDEADVNALY